MVYGEGGAGKTTFTLDGGFHLGAGVDWLGFKAKRVRVLIIEAEGPRPLFRRKLRRKLESWEGPPLDGQVRIWATPWASFTFADETCRNELRASSRSRRSTW